MHISDRRPKHSVLSMKPRRIYIHSSSAAGRSGGRWLVAMALRIAVLSAVGGCIAPPTVTPSQCGDGIHDEIAGEECDDGGQSATCNMDCTLAACGDGHANAAAGEECDDGNEISGDGCSITCRFEGCGDGVIAEAAGEQCDDGNRVSGDSCSADCRSTEICGNGIVDAGEACDDGGESLRCNASCTEARCGDFEVNTAAGETCDTGGVDAAGCDRDCTEPVCGDFVFNTAAGEACDTGGVDTAACDGDCTLPVCGDVEVNPAAGESCDEGGVNTGSCDGNCTAPACGDGWVNVERGEACDEGGDAASCDRDCTPAACGDGQINPVRGESCDDGNTLSGDGCSASCWLERCGNGAVDPGETCDDGDHLSGDGCSADCRSTEICGNGIVDAGEACDDGGESLRCNASCTEASCGDRVVNGAAGETCDEGGVNTAACDGDCTAPACGDAWVNVERGEACDEGGDTASCDRDCTAVTCGDGLINVVAGEQCDSSVDIALCDADCTVAWCGDGHVNAARGETCDDGNAIAGDGCSADCRSDEVCGNGVVDAAAGEQCDDSGESDLCDNDCTLALCGDGEVNVLAGEACDQGGVDTATCNMNCTVPICGDGHVNLAAGEDCESGGESLFCDGDCTFVWCGDGTPNTVAGEECDDGNVDDGDWCLATCESASCEDGIRNGHEEEVDCGGYCDACLQIQPMVAASVYHTCALLESGAVRCWGAGDYGRLGYGNTNDIGDDEVPATAGNVNVDSHLRVVQLAAGYLHTCAVLESGAVRCWGYGGDGQLGYGNTGNIGDDEAPATAGEVNVGGPVVQLAAGIFHTCALLETGAVRCWGEGRYGQLGSGNTANIGDNETPASAGDVNVGGPVVQLEAGNFHTCALLETGVVRCWGRGQAGQLGYGNIDNVGDNETPAMAGDVSVGGPVVQLAAGGEHTCALLETGAVRCWGEAWDGQLGYGNTNHIGDNETPATAGDVSVGGPVVQLAAGGEHTCALLETGAARCWGKSMDGQLGYGNTSNVGDDETPASAGDVNVGGSMVQLAAGRDHTCALLETGAVRCWGRGAAGQLGYGNTNNLGDDEAPASAGDVDVGLDIGVLRPPLAAGWQHTCMVRETGAMRCWGLGGHGRLGYGNTSDIGDDEVPATAGDVNVGSRVVQPAAGVYHTCALLETGAVRCWGSGGEGRLGYGNMNNIGDNETPELAGNVNIGEDVVQLATSHHTCALLERGAVRCWGASQYGQLGYGNTNDIGDNETPATAGDVDVGGRVVQLAAGGYHTCALLQTGAVRCWGRGTEGQLGYGNTSNIGDDEVPATAGDVDVGGRVVQLAAGDKHTCALMETGAVRCWGDGRHGRLGYGNTNYIGDDEVPATAGDVNVGGRVVQLAAGNSYTCALLETSAVRCWGASSTGQLGHGNTSNIGDNEVPATAGDVSVGGRVVQLAAGGHHACALLETGAVRCWGWGVYGRLGYGNTSSIGDDETPASAGDVPYR
jgi:cysteine-rich repeat protein